MLCNIETVMLIPIDVFHSLSHESCGVRILIMIIYLLKLKFSIWHKQYNLSILFISFMFQPYNNAAVFQFANLTYVKNYRVMEGEIESLDGLGYFVPRACYNKPTYRYVDGDFE